jgi:hypothetical protein
MASAKKRRGSPEFFADGQSPEAMRRQFISDPAQASIQPGLAMGMELLVLMRVLPEAFRQSQERELERLKRQGKDAGPRMESIQRSLAEAQALEEVAGRGQARIERLVMASIQPERCFHGFVSDTDGKPLPGLVVRLGMEGRQKDRSLEAETCDDGYFRIALPSGGDKVKEAKGDAGGLESGLHAALAAIELRTARPAEASADGAGKSIPGRIAIYSRDQKLLHTDPAPVELAEGSAYREYMIDPVESRKPPTPAKPDPAVKERTPPATGTPTSKEAAALLSKKRAAAKHSPRKAPR